MPKKKKKEMLVPLNGNRGHMRAGLARFLLLLLLFFNQKNYTLKLSANQAVLKTKFCDTIFIKNISKLLYLYIPLAQWVFSFYNTTINKIYMK